MPSLTGLLKESESFPVVFKVLGVAVALAIFLTVKAAA
jgi:hypothetical protein